MVEIGKNGMVKKLDAIETGLPMFDFSNELGINGLKFNFCTKAELAILKIELDERESKDMIVGFVRHKNYRGYLPLYDLQEIIDKR